MNSYQGVDVTDLLSQTLLAFSLSHADFWVIRAIGITSESRVRIAQLAETLSSEPSSLRPANFAAADISIDSLLDRDVLQVITAASLESIAGYVSLSSDVYGPTDPLPNVGQLDFTADGSKLFLQIESNVFGWADTLDQACRRDIGAKQIEVIGTTEESVNEFIEACVCHDEDVVHITIPTPLGPWRDRWWRVFRSGFCSLVTISGDPPKQGNRQPSPMNLE